MNGSSSAAGWSSSVARWAHNPEVVGSNPAPATNVIQKSTLPQGAFLVFAMFAEVRLPHEDEIATLACGYNGSIGTPKAMGALRMGLAEHELKPIVDAWRAANPRIVQLWAEVEQASTDVITTRQPIWLRNLRFTVESGILFITPALG